jgi:hypothetical protein
MRKGRLQLSAAEIRINKRWFSWMALVFMCLNSISAGAEDLEAALTRALSNAQYRGTTPREWKAVQDLFVKTMRHPGRAADLVSQWHALGYALSRVEIQNQELWILQEEPGGTRGQGFYLFRSDPGLSWILEAPHAKNDFHTGVIAFRLFIESQARAVAISTVNRRKADLAHTTNSFFHAFTLAAAEVFPGAIFMQLHGFEAAKRQDSGTEPYDLVISHGRRQQPDWYVQAVRNFRQLLPDRVRAYPDDINELAGTRNAQAVALHQVGHNGFLHLEMSLTLRERLNSKASLRRQWLQCLPIERKP